MTTTPNPIWHLTRTRHFTLCGRHTSRCLTTADESAFLNATNRRHCPDCLWLAATHNLPYPTDQDTDRATSPRDPEKRVQTP